MDTVCSEEQGSQNELEGAEGDVGCDEESTGGAGSEDRCPEVLDEGCHFFWNVDKGGLYYRF